ncbi:DUF2937 family protein [Lichenihabitans psoromatis]|uniref:DUF2937 family protein n=1 Tax=Lichenihabitans psoromatis TaxID=2528642 RepID=UPI0010360C1E|nr:DUF2937 family protein [Lichenihabitans psoromatis]
MIFRRFALAIGLLFAGLASQLPEFTQQYKQRLGGAIDELRSIVTQFDAEAASQSLNRDQGIARLRGNSDVLAQERGASIAETTAREERLERQRASFDTAGPLSQYAVLAKDFDPGIARQAYADYQPALPVTTAGFVSAGIGLVVGWLATHLVALPIRRRRFPPTTGITRV